MNSSYDIDMVNSYVNLILHYGTEGCFTGLCCYIAIVLGTISTFCTFLLPLSVLAMQAAGTVQQAGRQLALTSSVQGSYKDAKSSRTVAVEVL